MLITESYISLVLSCNFLRNKFFYLVEKLCCVKKNLLACALHYEKEKSWLFSVFLITLWDVFNLFPVRGQFRCPLFQGDAVWKDIRVRWVRNKAIQTEEAGLSELLRMCFVTVPSPIGTRYMLPSSQVMHLGWQKVRKNRALWCCWSQFSVSDFSL